MKRDRLLRSLALHALLLPLALLFLAPIAWMLIAATLPNAEILAAPPTLLPGTHLAENWRDLNADLDFVRVMINSIGISIIFTSVATLIAAMTGYAFAKFRFVGRGVLFTIVIAALTIPFEVRAIPQYLLVARDMGLSNTWWAIILPWIAYPLGVFFMRQNMLSVPSDLLEAARIDGAGELRIFAQIVLPIMRPALAAVAIVLFLFQWNDYFWPLLILSQKDAYTIPVALGTLVGLTRVSWGGIMVGTAIATLPFLLLFLWLQRYFIAGITAGAVKD
ncbi:MAG: carbohydrate ABC transporter permease [Trueperaceae bacterium]|nr:carbohydrate ABC transporter permease [Trueperaceae bacterium]